MGTPILQANAKKKKKKKKIIIMECYFFADHFFLQINFSVAKY